MWLLLCVVSVALLAAAGVLISVIADIRKYTVRTTMDKIFLRGGEPVSGEAIRQRDLLAKDRKYDQATVVSGCMRHEIRLTDCESGRERQAVFADSIFLGSVQEGKGIRLLVEEEGISRTHCRIFFRQGKYGVEDCRSTNHTWLNGHLLDRPRCIRDGDCLRLGKKSYYIRLRERR